MTSLPNVHYAAIFVFGFVAFCITPICYIKGKILLINRYVKS